MTDGQTTLAISSMAIPEILYKTSTALTNVQ